MSQSIWNRPSGDRCLFVGWMLTSWCNYSCPYCGPSHPRKVEAVPDSRGIPSFPHAFDNQPPEAWARALEAIPCSTLALGITGGEPFLDRANFRRMLIELDRMDKVDNVRIDTNGTWKPEEFREVEFRKVYLNVSYHPSQCPLEAFVTRLQSFLDAGIKIAMVNYVMSRDNAPSFPRVRDALGRIGVKVNPAVCNDEVWPKTEEELAWVRPHLHPFDLALKSGLVSPRGLLCAYPGLGFFLLASGDYALGCDKAIIGNIFDPPVQLPDPALAVCPKERCFCLHQYSFLEGFDRNRYSLNTLQCYVNDAIL